MSNAESTSILQTKCSSDHLTVAETSPPFQTISWTFWIGHSRPLFVVFTWRRGTMGTLVSLWQTLTLWLFLPSFLLLPFFLQVCHFLWSFLMYLSLFLTDSCLTYFRFYTIFLSLSFFEVFVTFFEVCHFVDFFLSLLSTYCCLPSFFLPSLSFFLQVLSPFLITI